MNFSAVKWKNKKEEKHPDAEYFVDTPSWFFDEEFKHINSGEAYFWYVFFALHENSTKIIVADLLEGVSMACKLESKEIFKAYLKEVEDYCNNHETTLNVKTVSIGFSFEFESFRVVDAKYVLLYDYTMSYWVFKNGIRLLERGFTYYNNVKNELEQIKEHRFGKPELFANANGGYYIFEISSVVDDEKTLKQKLYDKLNLEFETLKNNYVNEYSKKVFSLLQEKLLTFYNSQNGNRD